MLIESLIASHRCYLPERRTLVRSFSIFELRIEKNTLLRSHVSHNDRLSRVIDRSVKSILKLCNKTAVDVYEWNALRCAKFLESLLNRSEWEIFFFFASRCRSFWRVKSTPFVFRVTYLRPLVFSRWPIPHQTKVYFQFLTHYLRSGWWKRRFSGFASEFFLRISFVNALRGLFRSPDPLLPSVTLELKIKIFFF